MASETWEQRTYENLSKRQQDAIDDLERQLKRKVTREDYNHIEWHRDQEGATAGWTSGPKLLEEIKSKRTAG